MKKLIYILLTVTFIVTIFVYLYSNKNTAIKNSNKYIDGNIVSSTSTPNSYFGFHKINDLNLSQNEKNILDRLVKRFVESYKPDQYQYTSKDFKVMYSNDNLMLVGIPSDREGCGYIISLIQTNSLNEISKSGCFVDYSFTGNYLILIDDNYGVRIYKAGSNKIVTLLNTVFDFNSQYTYSKIDLYNSPDIIKPQVNFEVKDNMLNIEVYKRGADATNTLARMATYKLD